MSFLSRLHLPPRSSLSKLSAWKWLYFGLGVKRWLALLFLGITLLSLGTAYILLSVYHEQPLPGIFYYLTLQFLPHLARALLFDISGITLVLYATWKLNESLLSAFVPRRTSVVEALYRRRQRHNALKIVAIGGGTGLSTLLRGLKNYTDNLTAIVTVADDGGSSGRLREELGLLPPGDFRQSIAALADAEPLMTRLLEYRFPQGSGLGGHSFGNLFIAAMAGITGSFDRALLESSRVLAVRGKILPSTLQNVVLNAEVRGSNSTQRARVRGESQIAKFGQPVERVFLEPEGVPAYPGAVRAILDADLVIAGPGSIYTSVIPNLLVGNICDALRATTAAKIYICNVATEHGETDHYTLEDHVAALDAHCGGVFKNVLANDNWRGSLPAHAQIDFVQPSLPLRESLHAYIFADVVDDKFPWRHDPEKLAREILRWYAQDRKSNNRKDVQLNTLATLDPSQTMEEQWQHV